MNYKHSLSMFILIILVLFFTACKTVADQNKAAPPAATDANSVSIANPAAVYCEKQGYQLKIRTDTEGNMYGVCIFPDGSECDEWAFFRGECAPAGQNPTTENKAVEAAKVLLATELKIKPNQISVFQVHATTWPDGCLGLAGAGETCSMVETPGFRVTLTVGGINYTFRTDLTGEIIRIETAGVRG